MHAILVYQWSTGSFVVDPITSVTFHNVLQQESPCGLNRSGTYLSPTSRSSRSPLNPDPGKCQGYFNPYPLLIWHYITSLVLYRLLNFLSYNLEIQTPGNDHFTRSVLDGKLMSIPRAQYFLPLQSFVNRTIGNKVLSGTAPVIVADT